MTFEFDMDETPNLPELDKREEPKVVFNLIEEFEEERMVAEQQMNEVEQTEAVEEINEVFNHSVEESNGLSSIEETLDEKPIDLRTLKVYQKHFKNAFIFKENLSIDKLQ